MTATKPREQSLAEKNGADYERTAYDLARSVLMLSEVLVCNLQQECCNMEFGEQATVPPSCLDDYKADRRRTAWCDPCKALAAVEKL